MEEFKSIRVLGAGAFGETILVEVIDEKHRKEWDNQVVIKKPHDKQKERTLIDELITNATLNNMLKGIKAKNIVKYLGHGFFNGYYVMVMEYVEGCNLRDEIGGIDTGRPIKFDKAFNIVKQV